MDIGGSRNYLCFSFPGSDLCYRTELTKGTNQIIAADEDEERQENNSYPSSVILGIKKNFRLEVRDKKNGKKLTKKQRQKFLYDCKIEVLIFLEGLCEELNKSIYAVGRPHLDLAANDPVRYITKWTYLKQPEITSRWTNEPSLKVDGKTNSVVRRQRMELNSWLKKTTKSARSEARGWGEYSEALVNKRQVANDLRVSSKDEENSFRDALMNCLDAIEWPRDTECKIKVSWSESEIVVHFKIDLPEHRDLPKELFIVDTDALMLGKRSTSDEEVETIWRSCVLSIVAALVQVAFNLCPRVSRVSVRAFQNLPVEGDPSQITPRLELELDRSDYVWDRHAVFKASVL